MCLMPWNFMSPTGHSLSTWRVSSYCPWKLLLWILRLTWLYPHQKVFLRLAKISVIFDEKYSLKAMGLLWLYAAVKLIALGRRKTIHYYLSTPIHQRTSPHQTLPLSWLPWPGIWSSNISNGPSPSEAEPSGVDSQKVMHEVNPILRSSHLSIPGSEVLKDIICN